MNHWKQYYKALFIFIMLFGFAQPVVAQTGTIVSVNPAYLEVDPGEHFSVDVVVEGVTDLFAFDVAISYDPTVITFDHAEFGDFLDEGFTIPVTQEPGTARCLLSQVSPADPKSGSGVLCTFYFVAGDNNAETTLEFSLAELSDKDGLLLSRQTTNGFVQVGQPKAGTEIYLPLIVLNAGK